MSSTAYRTSPFRVVTVCGTSGVEWLKGDVVRSQGDFGGVGISPAGPVGSALISLEGAAIACEGHAAGLRDGESAAAPGGDVRGIRAGNLVTWALEKTSRNPHTSIVIVSL